MSLTSRWRAAKAERSLDGQIRALQSRLSGLPASNPARAEVLNDLGNRLRDRYLRTGEGEDIEQAIELYRQALTAPGDQAVTHLVSANLTAALVDRYHAGGDLADLDSAIRAAREAADAGGAEPRDRALYLINLANALNERYERSRHRPDIEDAIASAERAIKLASDDTRLAAVAGINLSAALIARNAAGDAARAAELLRQAATKLPDGSPEQQQARLGLQTARTAVSAPGGMGLVADDATIRAWTEAARQAPTGSLRRAAFLHAIGKARWARYQRDGPRAELDAAITALQTAVDEAPPDAGDLPRFLNDLGIAFSELSFASDSAQGLTQALAVWVHALLLLEDGFGSVAVPYKVGQQALGVGLGLAERVVSTYLLLADRAVTGRDRMLRNALLTAEATKTRLLTELLGYGNLPDPIGVAVEHLARERSVVNELRAVDTAAMAERGRAIDVDDEDRERHIQRRALRRELDQLWETIAASGESGKEYVELRRGKRFAWETMAELAALAGPGTAFASMFVTNSRTLLFVFRAGLDAPAVCQVEMGREDWVDVMDRFDREVRRGVSAGTETWDEPLRPLLRAAVPHLVGVERVVLAPAVWGVQLPWRAVARRAGWRSLDERAMPIVTVESLSLLHRLLRRNRAATRGSVVVGNPTGDLLHAEAEAMSIGSMLGVKPLLGVAATRAALRSAMGCASIAHIAGHAVFKAGAPLDSGIVLADGVLTAREIMADRIDLDLVVLSACETGTAESLGGNEFAGLSQAFLVAGVRCVVASLWKVDDPVTAVLMARFYRNWLAGADLARALADARDATDLETTVDPSVMRRQRDARTARAHAAPSTTYYWDSFVISGDWRAKSSDPAPRTRRPGPEGVDEH